ncbi:MAG: hypothetical protein ACE5FL_00010 [Myxococcota bacterium]
MQRGRSDWIAGSVLAALAAALLLPNLGESYLWQDEAQTAVVARTILTDGVPRGTDGKNFFSQEQGREYGEGHLWKWHTWGSFYLTAASLFALGETTTAARLPFALLGVASVVLAYFAGLTLWRDRRAAVAGACMLALSVPFLILSRQCRYYAAAGFLSLLGLHAYSRLRPAARAPAWWLFAAAVGLFHAHYVYCATLLASLVVHALLFERARLRPVVAVVFWTALLDLPWIVWFSDVRPAGESYAASVVDVAKFASFNLDYWALIFRWIFDPRFLLIVPVLVLWRHRSGEPPFDVTPETRRNVWLLVLYAAVSVALLSLLSPLLFYRYLAPLFAPAFLLTGLLVGSLMRRSVVLAAAVVISWAATGTLFLHLVELRGEYQGPIEGIVRFLDEHADPADVVAISYGDMPLKFYTNLRIVGGLTGENLAPARTANWIVVRHFVNNDVDRRIRDELKGIVEAGGYRARRIDAPDTPFENRESPDVHRFRTAPRRVPRVVIFERMR